jgi:hypothetical protein
MTDTAEILAERLTSFRRAQALFAGLVEAEAKRLQQRAAVFAKMGNDDSERSLRGEADRLLLLAGNMQAYPPDAFVANTPEKSAS